MKTLATNEIRSNFGEAVISVQYTNQPIVIKRNKTDAAALVPMSVLRSALLRERQARETMGPVLDELRGINADLDEDSVLQDMQDVVDQVRRERFAK